MKSIPPGRKPPHGTSVGTLTRMLRDAGFEVSAYTKRVHYEHDSGARVTIPHGWTAHDSAPRSFICEVINAIALAKRGRV